MNETMSLLLATTVLALSGLGLYVYKSSNDENYNENADDDNDSLKIDEYDEGSLTDLNDTNYDDDYELEYYDYKPKKNDKKMKTKRNKRNIGTKRKYY